MSRIRAVALPLVCLATVANAQPGPESEPPATVPTATAIEPTSAAPTAAVEPSAVEPSAVEPTAAAPTAAAPTVQGEPAVDEPAVDAPPVDDPDATPTNDGDETADDFLTRCSGCHTVGGGAMKGPDLAPATQWLEADLVASVKKMEKHVGDISEEDVAKFVALIKDPTLTERLTAERARSSALIAASLDAPDPMLGAALFFGGEALAKGGMPCGFCHRAGDRGGALGPDLTALKDRLPHTAMMSAIEGANFPVMKPAYADHPIAKQEAVHMAAFLEALEGAEGAEDAPWLPLAGGGMAVFLLFGIGLTLGGNRGPAGIRARMVRDVQRKL